jgi:hypothetical protein
MAIMRDKESIQQSSLADINSKYLYLPTTYQIIGVFRLLGLGFKDERGPILYSSMLLVRSGEGKSLVIAIAMAVLAFLD